MHVFLKVENRRPACPGRTADRNDRAGRALRAGPRVFTRLVIAATLLLLAGCKPGMHWRLGRFDDAHEEARAAGKLTFVYFRNWYSTDCANFEDNVLSNPAVRSATAKLVNVPLEYDVAADRKLADRCGVTNVPAVVILDAAGSVLERVSGECSPTDLVAAIERAEAARQSQDKGGSP